MSLTRNQRFGVITFFALVAASVVVTIEPWKSSAGLAEGSLAGLPAPGRIDWERLETGHPFSPGQDTVRTYRGFDLAYEEEHEQAAWVAYVLTRDEVTGGIHPRSDDYRPDTTIRSGSASLLDYRGSGFDRGHLAPAADMKWDPLAMSESFLLSNMSPQDHSLNRGIWRRLEEQVRRWAVEKDSLYVVTGPVLSRLEATIGENRVSVPAYYYKVLADLSPPGHSFIAFLVPHEGSSRDLLDFAVTVDSLEAFSGIDFFATAPHPEMIDWLESRLDKSDWE